MSWQRVAIVVEGRFAEAIAEALELAGAISTEWVDADAGTPEEQAQFAEPGATTSAWPRCRVSALFPEATDVSAALEEALEGAGAATLAAASIDRLDDADWVALTQRDFPPMRVGQRLWIVPTWHAPPEPDAINIVLDPGAAFGTGSHPTTRLCLAWLEREVRPGDAVLDYGCGSGILAIAALRLGAGSATGVDIDPLALEAARYNAQRNAVSLTLATAQSMLPAQFRLTLANILANPLRLLAPLLAAHTQPAGAIALSGILSGQAAGVIEAYAPWFALEVAGREEDWVLLSGIRRQTEVAA
jgi:ribosomal protein L11 methyltransferase